MAAAATFSVLTTTMSLLLLVVGWSGTAASTSSAPDIHMGEGIFTSSSDLQSLLRTEAEVVRQLNLYISGEEQRIAELKQQLARYETMYNEASSDMEKYVANPLNSFRLIKSLTADWKRLVDKLVLAPSSRESSLLQLKSSNASSQPNGGAPFLKWPSEEDLNGAATALIRLKDTYNLRPSDMAAGVLSGKSYGTHLTANDCFEIGRQSYQNGDNEHSVQWMVAALDRWEIEADDHKTVKKGDILEYLAFSHFNLGNLRAALEESRELLEVEPDHPRAPGNIRYYEYALAKEEEATDSATQKEAQEKKGDDGSDTVDMSRLGMASNKLLEMVPALKRSSSFQKYKELCRGEGGPDEEVRSKLLCFYTRGFHPYLTLMPFKVEELNLAPRIVMHHEVLTDSEIYTIKSLATSRLERSTVQNAESGLMEPASYRISKTAWLKRSESSTVDRIYRRVGHLTGLSMDISEDLQVANYGMGGHYDPHFDHARKDDEGAFQTLGMGNRLATWLFYVSDVELGGATVFPDLNLTVYPRKGSAAFWFNLHKNGEGDSRTLHAACPVLAGTKWVSNFWIHERGQDFRRPCTLDPFE